MLTAVAHAIAPTRQNGGMTTTADPPRAPESEDGPSPRGRRHRRWLVAGVVSLALLLVIVSGCSWYLSERIADGALVPDHGPDTFGLVVVEASDESVRVRAHDDSNWDRAGIWALEWRDGTSSGWVQLGDPIEVDREAQETVRPLLSGAAPPVGAEGRFENFAVLGTPWDSGWLFTPIEYEAAEGQAGAWLVCEGRSRWAIHVHGKDGDPREALRILPTLSGEGFTTLAIGYSNDADAPPTESGRFEYGASEWRDLEGAVRFAVIHGAEEIVLIGHSMGGAIVASFLLESELVSEVDAAFLDAPMLDLRRTVALGLDEGGVPGVFQALPIWLTGQRFDLDWSQLDYAGRAEEFVTPMLIVHGGDDRTTPIGASEELAEARPDLVTLELFEDAHHTGAWNVAPDRYEALLSGFVAAQLGPAGEVAGCAAGSGTAEAAIR